MRPWTESTQESNSTLIVQARPCRVLAPPARCVAVCLPACSNTCAYRTWPADAACISCECACTCSALVLMLRGACGTRRGQLARGQGAGDEGLHRAVPGAARSCQVGARSTGQGRGAEAAGPLDHGACACPHVCVRLVCRPLCVFVSRGVRMHTKVQVFGPRCMSMAAHVCTEESRSIWTTCVRACMHVWLCALVHRNACLGVNARAFVHMDEHSLRVMHVGGAGMRLCV